MRTEHRRSGQRGSRQRQLTASREAYFLYNPEMMLSRASASFATSLFMSSTVAGADGSSLAGRAAFSNLLTSM